MAQDDWDGFGVVGACLMLFLESDNSRIREVRGAHRGSLGFARDDKGECGAFRGDWYVDEGNSRSLRSGRDDNSSWELYLAFPNKIVIPSEAEGSAVRPSDFPNSGVLTQTP